MKTKIKVTIGGNVYEIESSYEFGIENIIKIIENAIKQDNLIDHKG